MKNLIKLLAIFLLLSTGIFAAVPAKTKGHKVYKAWSIKSMVTFSSLPSRRGINVKLKNDDAEKAIVMIYDYKNDLVWKDVLSKKKMQKAFILNELDNGNYTFEVMLGEQTVRKIAHVYYKGDSKLVAIRG